MEKKVLIVSDDPEFVNSLVLVWPGSSCIPEFQLCGTRGNCDCSQSSIAVLDGPEGLANLTAEVSLAIAITGDEPLPEAGVAGRQAVQIRRRTGWAEVAAALAQEAFLRANALQRVAELEHRLMESERLVALGSFIDNARHGLGNALTSVLGNSELLLESELGLQQQVRGQLETIHAMSLKIYETLQGLSSLKTASQAAEQKALR